MPSTVSTRVKDLATAVTTRYPSLQTPAERLWCAYVWARMEVSARHNAWQHVRHAPIDQYRLVRVDPARIEYVTEDHFPGSKFHHVGEVRPGDWDRSETRFVETPVYRAFEAHFEEGVPWGETEFYRDVVERIEAGAVLWGCETQADFDRRCDRLESLYEALATEGYRTQAELDDDDDPMEKNRTAWVQRLVYDEMTVNVGRDGELLFYDGRNRLAIAKLLGLDSVPVWILVRHAGWQETREWVAEMDDRRAVPDQLRDHPDLRSFLGGAHVDGREAEPDPDESDSVTSTGRTPEDPDGEPRHRRR